MNASCKISNVSQKSALVKFMFNGCVKLHFICEFPCIKRRGMENMAIVQQFLVEMIRWGVDWWVGGGRTGVVKRSNLAFMTF